VIIYPAVVTVFAVPIFAFAKKEEGAPPSVTLERSAATTPIREGVPLNVAKVEPLYVLLSPVSPLIVRLIAVMFAVKPVG